MHYLTITCLLVIGTAKLGWGGLSSSTTTASVGLSSTVSNQPPPHCYGQVPPASVFAENCFTAIREIEGRFTAETVYVFTKFRFPGDRFRKLPIVKETGTCNVRLQFELGSRYARLRWEAVDVPLRALWHDCARARGSEGFIHVDGPLGPLILFITRFHSTSPIEDAGGASANTSEVEK